MKKILICDPIGQDGIGYLQEKGYEVVHRPDITPEQVLVAVSDVDALMVRSRTKVTAEVIRAANRMKVIARSGTGTDNIDKVAAKERGIVVVNAPGANAESVAEHVFAFLLALARSLVPAVNTLKSGTWAKSDFSGMEIKNKSLGIIGFGYIGKRVAELGNAFGMETIIHPKGEPLDAVLSADFVSLHVPLTDQTRGMIGASELEKMKKSAFLINTARGALIDESALISALQTGDIAGAALDVFATEPISPESELLTLKNVIVTPHVAADSRESENRASLMVAKDVDHVLQGLKPEHPV